MSHHHTAETVGPYRLTSAPLSSEMLHLHNVRADLVGHKRLAYREAEAEIAKILRAKETKKELSGAQMERWATHPDERVTIALLENHHLPVDLQSIVLLIAHEDAKHNSHAWTPLLDALSANKQWPKKVFNSEFDEERYLKRVKLSHLKVISGARDYLSDGEQWLKKESTAQDLLALSTFRSPLLCRSVLQEGREITLEVLKAFSHGEDPFAWKDIAHNPAIPAESLLPWVEERFLREIEVLDSSAEKMSVVDEAGGAAGALAQIRARAAKRTGELKPATEQSGDVERSLFAKWKLFHRASITSGRVGLSGLCELIATSPSLSEEELHSFYDQLLPVQDGWKAIWVSRLVKAPGAGEGLWFRIAQDFPTEKKVRATIAAHPRARWIKKIRSRLLASKRAEVLLPLLEDAPPSDVERILRTLEEQDSADMLRALEMVSAKQLSGLSREAMTSLLANPDAQLRLAVMRALGRGREEREESGREGREGRDGDSFPLKPSTTGGSSRQRRVR